MGDAGLGMRFALASFAVWRVTHLLAEEDGPAHAVVRLRTGLGQGQLGELMDCFYCLSVWVAAPASLAVARRRRELPLALIALSGAACLLERATSERATPAAEIVDWKGVEDGLLWNEAEGAQGEPAAHAR
jgi:Protein of unknown function (DUF1360)